MMPTDSRYRHFYVARLKEAVVPKDKADLLQGTLDMLILKSLSLGELHGYGIIQRLRQLSDEMLNVEQGSLYPALYRIEQKGWVSARWDANNSKHRKQVGTGSYWRSQKFARRRPNTNTD